jgi:hypothetical protein
MQSTLTIALRVRTTSRCLGMKKGATWVGDERGQQAADPLLALLLLSLPFSSISLSYKHTRSFSPPSPPCVSPFQPFSSELQKRKGPPSLYPRSVVFLRLYTKHTYHSLLRGPARPGRQHPCFQTRDCTTYVCVSNYEYITHDVDTRERERGKRERETSFPPHSFPLLLLFLTLVMISSITPRNRCKLRSRASASSIVRIDSRENK